MIYAPISRKPSIQRSFRAACGSERPRLSASRSFSTTAARKGRRRISTSQGSSSRMKRQALGKGLGSLIPGKPREDLLAATNASHSTEGEARSQMSAADISAIDIASIANTPRREHSGSAAGPSDAAVGPSDASLSLAGGDRSIAPEGEASGRAGALQWIDIDRIKPNPLQPRKQFPPEQIE